MVLNDFQRGKLPYYVKPPGCEEKEAQEKEEENEKIEDEEVTEKNEETIQGDDENKDSS